METKQIEVACPCCSTHLTIDVLTRTIFRAVSPRDLDDTGKPVLDESRWDTASDLIEERGLDADNRLESALSAERDKEARLDDLFDKANEKLKRGPEDPSELDH